MRILRRDTPAFGKRGYFARFFGFARAFGVYGSGGLVNIVRNNASVRFSASPRGSKSSDSISRFAADVLRLVMVGV